MREPDMRRLDRLVERLVGDVGAAVCSRPCSSCSAMISVCSRLWRIGEPRDVARLAKEARAEGALSARMALGDGPRPIT